MPTELNPAATKKFLISGVSPSRYLLSTVKLSGPLKNVFIPALPRCGNLLIALSRIGSK